MRLRYLVPGILLLAPSTGYLGYLAAKEVAYFMYHESVSMPGCELIIPKLHLRERINTTSPDYGVYYEITTPPPGEKGITVFYGHRTLFGSPFLHLDELKRGDKVVVYWFGSKYVYVVYGKAVVPPDYVIDPDASSRDELWLVTCTPISTARERLIVKCVRVG
ncbi:class E sortase [Methanopyrus sp.]